MRPSGWLIVGAALAWASPGRGQQAPTTTLNQITRVEVSDGSVRIGCTQKPNFTTLTLSAPSRLVIDFSDTVLLEKPHDLGVHQGALTSVRTETFRSDTSSVSRVVIGLAAEADTDIEALPDNSLRVRVTAVQSAPTLARGTANQPKVEVVSSADLEARAAAQERNASEAQQQAKAAKESQAKSDASAQADRHARADAEAKAKSESEARQAAEAKAQAAEKRLAEMEAQAQADAKARQAAEAKADQESKARAVAEAQAQKETKARAAAEAAEAARAREAQAAADRAADEQRRADAARAKQQMAEEQAHRAAEEARQAEVDRKRQVAEAAEQARSAEDARRKQAAAEEAQKEARKAETDRLAQLQAQKAQEAARQEKEVARQDQEAKKRADAEARAEAKRLADQKAAESRAQVASTPEAPLGHDTSQVRVAALETDAPAVRGGTKDISLVGFRQTSGGSRVFVRASDVVKYSVTQGGANRVVLEVENARISQRNGTRPLDTSFFDGPVTLIAPSEDRHAHTVRVVIDLREMVPYQTRLEGNDVVIDFQG
jgi:colicin import membrane protein